MNRTYLFITVLALVMGASATMAQGQASFFGEEDLNPNSATLNQEEKFIVQHIIDKEQKRREKFRLKGVKYHVLRYRFARINREAILNDSVEFNFFSDRKVKIKTKSVERLAPSDLMHEPQTQWKGEYHRVYGKEICTISFIGTEDYISFDWPDSPYYHSSNGRYVWVVKVTKLRGNVCMIEEIDTSATIGCGLMNRYPQKEQITHDKIQKLISHQDVNLGENVANGEDSIKVLVCYTNASFQSDTGIVSKIVTWVNTANAVFNNNQVSTKIKLVRTAMVYYNGDESDYSKLLDELTNTNDGKLDEVPRLRNAYAADFVVLVVDDNEPGTGGTVEGKTKLQGAQLNSEFAYSVVWAFAQNLTFAHEIGHLRGADHQVGISGYTYPSPYSTARAFSYGTSWRTIMSIKTSTASGPRISYYSSPNRFYQGLPIGTFNENNESALNATSSQNLNYRIGNVLLLANDTIRNREIAIASATTSTDTDNKVVIALNGSDVRFTAGSKVTLKPGFRAATGSKFVAKIGTGSTASEGLTVTPNGIVAARASAAANEEQPEKRAATESVSEVSALPTAFALFQNYPNPFNPTTTIRYALPRSAKVALAVYDVLGRKTMELVNETKAAGFYEVSLNASRLSSGTYFYRLQAGEYVETRKMVVMK